MLSQLRWKLRGKLTKEPDCEGGSHSLMGKVNGNIGPVQDRGWRLFILFFQGFEHSAVSPFEKNAPPCPK